MGLKRAAFLSHELSSLLRVTLSGSDANFFGCELCFFNFETMLLVLKAILCATVSWAASLDSLPVVTLAVVMVLTKCD